MDIILTAKQLGTLLGVSFLAGFLTALSIVVS